jgi:hypothetical protein
METITVPGRFNGPLQSGNGGYTAGVIAGHLGGVAEVSLRSPVPLDEPLTLVEEDGGARVLAGEGLVAEARAVPGIAIEVPPSVGVEEARRARERYRGLDHGTFSRCFVCGLDREDSFGVFAGEVEGRQVVASTWTPPAWAAGPSGALRPEFVWAALDCPTYFAAHLGQELTASMLVRQTAEVTGDVVPAEEHVVVSWPIEQERRKRLAGCAVLSAAGETLARAEVLLVEPRSAS